MTPPAILLPLGDALRTWRSAVCAPHMPTADEHAAIAAVLWSVSYRDCVDETVWEVVQGMAFSDELYEHAFLTEQDKEAVFRSTFELARVVFNALEEVKAYRQGVFPYELEGIMHDDTLILRPVRPG